LISLLTALALLRIIPIMISIPVRAAAMEEEIYDLQHSEKSLNLKNEALSKFRSITHNVRQALDSQTILSNSVEQIGSVMNLDRCLIYLPAKSTLTGVDSLDCQYQYVSPVYVARGSRKYNPSHFSGGGAKSASTTSLTLDNKYVAMTLGSHDVIDVPSYDSPFDVEQDECGWISRIVSRPWSWDGSVEVVVCLVGLVGLMSPFSL
jgi:hypothetical protein